MQNTEHNTEQQLSAIFLLFAGRLKWQGGSGRGLIALGLCVVAPFSIYKALFSVSQHLAITPLLADYIKSTWWLVFLKKGGYCVLNANLGSCGLGQRVQHPLHDDFMPNERQSSMILHSSGYHPSVQSIQKRCSARAAVKKSQPHPAMERQRWMSQPQTQYQHFCMRWLRWKRSYLPPLCLSLCVGVMRWVFTMQCTMLILLLFSLWAAAARSKASQLSLEDICLHIYGSTSTQIYNSFKQWLRISDSEYTFADFCTRFINLSLHLEIIHIYKSAYADTQLSTHICE